MRVVTTVTLQNWFNHNELSRGHQLSRQAKRAVVQSQVDYRAEAGTEAGEPLFSRRSSS
jgi:hypothetical protein